MLQVVRVCYMYALSVLGAFLFDILRQYTHILLGSLKVGMMGNKTVQGDSHPSSAGGQTPTSTGSEDLKIGDVLYTLRALESNRVYPVISKME